MGYSAGIETTVIDKWLVAMLEGDPTLDSLAGWNGVPQVWDGVADEGTPNPRVTFQLVSAEPGQVFNGRRILINATYQVVVDSVSDTFTELDAMACRIDTLLDLFVGACVDGYIHSCQRGGSVKLEMEQDGVRYKRLGAEFRIQASRSS